MRHREKMSLGYCSTVWSKMWLQWLGLDWYWYSRHSQEIILAFLTFGSYVILAHFRKKVTPQMFAWNLHQMWWFPWVVKSFKVHFQRQWQRWICIKWLKMAIKYFSNGNRYIITCGINMYQSENDLGATHQQHLHPLRPSRTGESTRWIHFSLLWLLGVRLRDALLPSSWLLAKRGFGWILILSNSY